MISILEIGGPASCSSIAPYSTGSYLHRSWNAFVENPTAPNIPQIYDAPDIDIDILEGRTQTAAFPLFATLITSRLMTRAAIQYVYFNFYGRFHFVYVLYEHNSVTGYCCPKM